MKTEYILPKDIEKRSFEIISRELKVPSVVGVEDLMDTVWAGVIVSERTVNVNITRLRKKLGPYAQNIVSRTGFGYLFEE